MGLNLDLDLTRQPLHLVCGLAPVFESQKLEDGRSVPEPQIEALGRLSRNRFEVSLAGDEAQWLQELRVPGDVIYAYCHGSSGNGNPCLWMTQRGKAISGSTIDSSADTNWSRNPLVILAACTSGAIDPFRAMGLANSFMARGARGYIATAEDFLKNLRYPEISENLLQRYKNEADFRAQFDSEITEVVQEQAGKEVHLLPHEDVNRAMGLLTGKSSYQRAPRENPSEGGRRGDSRIRTYS